MATKERLWRDMCDRALDFRPAVDNVIGELPNWFPLDFRSRVLISRFRVLLDLARERYSLGQLRRAMLQEVQPQQVGQDLIVRLNTPRNIHLRSRLDDVQVLCQARQLRELGAEQGLQTLIGMDLTADAAVGRQQRDRGKEGGKVSGRRRREKSQRASVVRAARSRLSAGEIRRGMAATLRACGIDLSERQINRILREELGPGR
jgi:hypothetical protein